MLPRSGSGTDDTAHWLHSAQQAVGTRAAQPGAGADTALYQQAADLVDQAQDCLAAGISPATLIGDRDSDTATGLDAEDAEPSRYSGGPTGSVPYGRPRRVVAKPTVPRYVWLLLTAVSAAYLVAITAATVGVAYSGGLGNGWVGWFYLPAHVGFSVIVAAYWGGGLVKWTAGATWIGPPLVLLMDVCMGALFHDAWPLPSYFPPAWLVWLVFCIPGLVSLPFAYRIWFGRLELAPAQYGRLSPAPDRIADD